MRVTSLALPAVIIAATSAQAAVITTERYNNGSIIVVDLPQQNLQARAADTGLQNRWNTILKQVGADNIKSMCNSVLPSVSTTQTIQVATHVPVTVSETVSSTISTTETATATVTATIDTTVVETAYATAYVTVAPAVRYDKRDVISGQTNALRSLYQQAPAFVLAQCSANGVNGVSTFTEYATQTIYEYATVTSTGLTTEIASETLTNTETATATYYSAEIIPTTISVMGAAKYPACVGSTGTSGWARYDGFKFVDAAASVGYTPSISNDGACLNWCNSWGPYYCQAYTEGTNRGCALYTDGFVSSSLTAQGGAYAKVRGTCGANKARVTADMDSACCNV
ncbi:hypothetical protein QFC22_006521 [Naganishia vaughanmartiniae]|uniref:Uncharacterized protein n=1 Tax=Naganishia vaughanmartiniae TaxID=1424756 RepID=A0ACC2WK18_9TREE|nr:hypothetical protein QFC22_006521 [Naganishia vaughanmartiniae]